MSDARGECAPCLPTTKSLRAFPAMTSLYPNIRGALRAALARRPEHSREQCRVSFAESEQRREPHAEWQRARGICDETFSRRRWLCRKKRRREKGGPSAASGCSRRTARRELARILLAAAAVRSRQGTIPRPYHFPFHLSTHPAWPTVILPSPLSTMPDHKGRGRSILFRRKRRPYAVTSPRCTQWPTFAKATG